MWLEIYGRRDYRWSVYWHLWPLDNEAEGGERVCKKRRRLQREVNRRPEQKPHVPPERVSSHAWVSEKEGACALLYRPSCTRPFTADQVIYLTPDEMMKWLPKVLLFDDKISLVHFQHTLLWGYRHSHALVSFFIFCMHALCGCAQWLTIITVILSGFWLLLVSEQLTSLTCKHGTLKFTTSLISYPAQCHQYTPSTLHICMYVWKFCDIIISQHSGVYKTQTPSTQAVETDNSEDCDVGAPCCQFSDDGVSMEIDWPTLNLKHKLSHGSVVHVLLGH